MGVSLSTTPSVCGGPFYITLTSVLPVLIMYCQHVISFFSLSNIHKLSWKLGFNLYWVTFVLYWNSVNFPTSFCRGSGFWWVILSCLSNSLSTALASHGTFLGLVFFPLYRMKTSLCSHNTLDKDYILTSNGMLSYFSTCLSIPLC